MSDHTFIRLETKEGSVIAYLAPSFEWEDSWSNSTINNELPGEDTQARIIDLDQWIGEITIQGSFEDSENLPQSHQTDLANISGFSLPVTAREQATRILKYSVFGSEVADTTGPYNLYIGDLEFTAQSVGGIDFSGTGAVLPNVALTEFRTPDEPPTSRNEYMLRFAVGFVSGD